MLTFDSIAILSKNEIEKQVQELISIGLTRHSTTSFSSPVLLVKVKDGTALLHRLLCP